MRFKYGALGAFQEGSNIMTDAPIKEKIIKHMDGLGDLERREGSDKVIQALSDRYDTPIFVVQKIIAEWQAGHSGTADNEDLSKKLKNNNREEE